MRETAETSTRARRPRQQHEQQGPPSRLPSSSSSTTTKTAMALRGSEYVRLAAELRECMSFQPRKWRQVLEQSTEVLQLQSPSPAQAQFQRPGPPPGRALVPTKASNGDTKSPFPTATATLSRRAEDDENDDGLRRADGDHGARRSPRPRLPRLAQYLHQPEMVAALLQEEEHAWGLRAHDDAIASDAAVDDQLLPDEDADRDVVDRMDNDDDEEDEEDDTAPVTDDHAAATPPAVTLPILSTVSPRTREGLARLPVLGAEELRAIRELERLADEGTRRRSLYGDLRRVLAQSPFTPRHRGRRRRKVALASASPVPGPGIRRRSPKAPTSTTTIAAATRRPGAVPAALNPRAEQIAMALEDLNVLSLSPPTPPMGPTEPPAVELAHDRAAIPRALITEHERLCEDQLAATTHVREAEARVERTLTELRQWLPLEVIYQFGLGAFASPEHQRATQLLFRVGQRLRHALVVQALIRWRAVVDEIRQAEAAAMTLMLQCWWRQVLARRAVSRRRHLRDELERRQRLMLQLLADRQNKSAGRITRAIRRYTVHRREARRQRELAAVRCLQSFWRRQQAHWLALRRHLRQQRRHQAAIVIQRHTRGRLARRRRRLLEKIRQVEGSLDDRRRRRLALGVARRRLGAVLLIQRAFRAWRQRQIERLRRRRAQFERDKARIVRVQAHYRGRRARRLARAHVVAVRRAVLVIQCAWRCFVARRIERERRRLRAEARAAAVASLAARTSTGGGAVKGLLKSRLRGQGALKSPWTAVKVATGKTPSGVSRVEVEAATRLQAHWRGRRLRQRLRREHARELEQGRRRVNRQRRLAAVCIQRRVRGILGRAAAWRRVLELSARRIQSAWRGHHTRCELVRMKRALGAIEKMQRQWRARRNQELQRQRGRAARRIQGLFRRALGRRWLFAAVRRQQLLSEEHVMGQALMLVTRRRVQDDLLLQSWVHPTLHVDPEDTGEAADVGRSLYEWQTKTRTWRRRGCDGLWQGLFADATGRAPEIDNSKFARLLKALPGFVHPRSFPTQTIDLIFAKMKEPRARTISFARFNKAMVLVWQARFAPPNAEANAHANHAKGNAPPAIPKEQQYEWMLRFMNDFVLPSSLQGGKYRPWLERLCTERLAWAVHVLGRFAQRIARRHRHDHFVIIFQRQRLLRRDDDAARVLQRAFRRRQTRRRLQGLLAGMFIEFIDYKGRSVRFRHIATQRELTRRPAFLRGVRCAKVVPLPYPGDEFRAFCERHEGIVDPTHRPRATIYCVECEDAVCGSCFARDHDKRATFQAHARRVIPQCHHCGAETATRECLQCGNGRVPYCDGCYPHVHADPTLAETHRFLALVVMCVECSSRVAQWRCEVCEDDYCKRCLTRLHAKGQRQSHPCKRLSYFPVLKRQAQEQRTTAAQKMHDQRREERAARRRAEEQRRQLRERSATRIQAVVRSRQARQRGRSYMKLVRQTHAAKAQRLKDEPTRSSWGYRLKSIVGLAPALKSDTKDEIAARQERLRAIKRALQFYRRRADDDSDDEDESQGSAPAGDGALTTNKKKTKKAKKRRWTKRERARLETAAKSWCAYGVQVKVTRGEWKDTVGSIVSTQSLFLTGHVLVFLPAAARAVVIDWEHLAAHDDDEILRQPYVSAPQVLATLAHDVRVRLSRVVDAAARRARLVYLQSIEFHDIVQTAWVVEYNKYAKKEEYWNVVLNRRTFEVPKAMMMIERMEPEARDELDKRVALAKSKLTRLLNPFHPIGKEHISSRRNAVVPIPPALKRSAATEFPKLHEEMDALQCARFWNEHIASNGEFGGKYAEQFLLALQANPPRSTKDCWLLMRFLQWFELHSDTSEYLTSTKAFFRKSSEHQLFIVKEMIPLLDASNMKDAAETFNRLTKLQEETLQLLVFNDAQQTAAAIDRGEINGSS